MSTDANWGRLPAGYQPPQTKKENVAIESLRGYFTTKISDANKETQSPFKIYSASPNPSKFQK